MSFGRGKFHQFHCMLFLKQTFRRAFRGHALMCKDHPIVMLLEWKLTAHRESQLVLVWVGIHLVPWPKRPVLWTSTAPRYPSILHTTSPSFLSQTSSHTVPQRRSWKTSTRPSWGPDPFTSRTKVSSTATHTQQQYTCILYFFFPKAKLWVCFDVRN